MNQIKTIVDDCIADMWMALDPNGKGVLEKHTAQYFVSLLSCAIEAHGGQVEPFDFDNDFDEFDTDGDGKLSRSEMRSFVEQLMGIPLISYFRFGGPMVNAADHRQCIESL
ncbi:hypothetical protein H257_14074 [Aphanomyces astaci]|uniref:EF-hand domain-containing protein n=1 Tax=Aphanomyces astaci TaxID=112090 RepID=W4FSB0_APHAT|nr:hypothetical protein H257_14074 [Aphanomyces astaci]ETV70395.1 hypothetical protein H257_14074 [Aphanomyces astaci]RHY09838.1 hypothetical protein DYB25_005524 [Aphanomyces astaci]RHY52978.1 hypothetical protein DYB34_008579 [Aphanomyces astaci]RHY55450.1 hypothetical protein DYB38_006452 [Aphanomyces astaci]RHY64677.1 hypothetical protein DYB30_006304 [Aphanomyces astaci]|eukprot:XP_009840107.1 hypothetical protein H257_14074 [Aphanomyces astaci]